MIDDSYMSDERLEELKKLTRKLDRGDPHDPTNNQGTWAVAERLKYVDHIKTYLCSKCLERFPYLEFEKHFKDCKGGER